MFFKPREAVLGDGVSLAKKAAVFGASGYAEEQLCKTVAQYAVSGGEISEIRAEVRKDIAQDGYEIDITNNEIRIRHSNARGLIYAAMTLRQLLETDGLKKGHITDSPDCEFRGYRAFLPGRRAFDDFYAAVDMLVYYKYNYLSLEVGGAMEYKRHPEINEKWAEFAAETHRYSGRTHEIQNGYAWAKNSIHTDNADGDILTQDEVRELIEYCRYRGLEVYPEVPTLSHTDYICMAHPELAERADDPYPDTYCPSKPQAYDIVFDILDEVIDVFEPKLINIGHDEYYSVCVCDKCRDKKPHEVFAEDVKKIHAYLTERGIKTYMWGDKLLPVVTPQGKTYGGAGFDRISKSTGYRIFSPPTFQCQSMLPRDITMINWYYVFGLQQDAVFSFQGYPTVLGNMAVANVREWRTRRRLGVKGGSCSNWGAFGEEYMQRNNQYLNIIMGAYALWSADYDTDSLPQLTERAFNEAYRLHFGDTNGGDYIEVTHTTETEIPYKVFYDGEFIEDERYRMGKYVLTYTDGTCAEFEVKYGKNISNDRISCVFGEDADKIDPTLSVAEDALGEVAYSTVPFKKNGRTWYRTAFKNPHPEKTPARFEYVSESGATAELLSVKF